MASETAPGSMRGILSKLVGGLLLLGLLFGCIYYFFLPRSELGKTVQGAGNSNISDNSSVPSSQTTGNSDKVDLDVLVQNGALSNGIGSTQVTDGSILFGDWANNNCNSGQIPKFNGTSWECGDDNEGSSTNTPSENNYLTSLNITGDSTKTLTIERNGLSDLTASFTDNAGGSGGGGSVIEVNSGNGLTGGSITTSGTLSINSPTCSGTDKLQWSGTAFICSPDLNDGTGSYTTSVTFSTTTGDLTVSRDGLGDIVTSLEGRYLTSFTETDPVWNAAESAYFNLSQNETITGTPNFNGGTSGSTAPFAVDSTFLVSNLNADLLDGQNGSFYQSADNINAGTLSVSHGGTGVGTLTSNGVLYGSGSGAVQVTSAGTSGQLLVANTSGVPTFVSMSGDISMNSAGLTAIQANSVGLTTDTTGNYQAGTSAGNGISVSGSAGEGWSPTISIDSDTCSGTDKLQWNGTDFVCASDVDTDTNNYVTAVAFDTSTGNLTTSRTGLADIVTSLDGRYLTSFSETDPVWSAAKSGYLNLSQNDTVTGTPNFNGGTSGSTAPFSVDSTFVVTNLNADLLDGQSGSFYQSADNINAGTLIVSRGGTGAGAFTSNGVLYGNGTNALQVTSAGTSAQLLVANGSGVPTFVSMSGDSTISNSGALTLANTAVTGGTYGSATQVGQFTVDSKGRLTFAGNVSISGTTPGGSAGGDLSGTYPSPNVSKINGISLGSTTATSGNVLVADGASWVTQSITGDIGINSSGLTTIQSNSVALTTDTTGNYQAGTTAGNGISISGSAGEGWSPTIAINSPTCSGTTEKLQWSGTAFVCGTDQNSGGTVTGSGTINYLPKWTSSTALGNSLIFDDGTNLGISTGSPGGKLDIKSTQTSGTLELLGAPSSVTLTGGLTGTNVDLSTSYTATGVNVTGQSISLPAVTNTGSGSYAYKGLTVNGGALVQQTTAGTDTWAGLDISMPNITQTTGSVTSTGLKITGGTVTSGTSYGLTIDSNAGNVGIGTTTPTARLYISQTNAANAEAIYIDTAETTATQSVWTLESDVTSSNTVKAHFEADGSIFVTLNGAASTFAVCHPTNGNVTNEELVDCNPTALGDYAEMYPVDNGIDYGDIVVTSNNTVNTKTGQTISKLTKSSTPYQANVIGIVSNNYEDFTSAGYNINGSDNPMPVALNGRVPIKVDPNSAAINIGDYVTTSSVPGRATKAIQSGFVVGKALESWTPGSGQDTVMIFVGNAWVSPEMDVFNNLVADYKAGNLGGSYVYWTDNGNGSIETTKNVIVASINGKAAAFDSMTGLELNIGNGSLVVDASGLVKVSKDLEIGGKINIAADTNSASVGSGQFAVGQTQVEIQTSAVKTNSKVFITPRSDVVLYVDQVNGGSFIVKMSVQKEEVVRFDWWVIN